MLQRLTERIWVFPYEEARDRPNLGYVRGDKWSLAVDAGHSDDHVRAFYRALEQAGLPLPALTVITHWHWDHALGLHAIHGLSLANGRTNGHLRALAARLKQEGEASFLALDPSIALEYAGGRPVRAISADMEFSGAVTLDPGGCPVRAFQTESPHTDDSTLLYAEGQGVLFLGDAACNEFGTGRMDLSRLKALRATVASLSPDLCLEGHWKPLSLKETLADMDESLPPDGL